MDLTHAMHTNSRRLLYQRNKLCGQQNCDNQTPHPFHKQINCTDKDTALKPKSFPLNNANMVFLSVN